ncbi:hypothetical protein K438DRAFT_1753440 [Mycena galopus ATCC 62051]|nr:hypothetical protein K438DRAFT_1753440 [Mycena galopus ATCC 62051]
MVSSNIETLAHHWIAEGWPEKYRFLHALGIPDDGAALEPYEIVPRTAASLQDWAYVDTNPSASERGRELRLLYKTAPLLRNTPGNVIYPIGICVQGFVTSCNLRALGNYSKGILPQSALQAIVLDGGDHRTQFQHYLTTVGEVVQHIYHCLDSEAPLTEESTSLFAGRRVFMKVHLELRPAQDDDGVQITPRNCHLPTALCAGDEPLHEAASIAANWRVLRKLSVGMYIVDDVHVTESDFVALDVSRIQVGDFVDVCIGFDIVACKTSRGGRTYKVHLSLQHMLLLAAREEATEEDTGAVAEEEIGLSF